MGCCATQPQSLLANSDGNEKHVFESGSVPRNIRNYLNSNQEKIQFVIKEKGPPIPVYNGNVKQAESLPRSALIVYDLDAHETELSFETDAIFSHPEDGTPDRIFYNEIRRISFAPIDGFNGNFVIFALDSKVGFRAFIFLQKKYISIITTIIKQGK